MRSTSRAVDIFQYLGKINTVFGTYNNVRFILEAIGVVQSSTSKIISAVDKSTAILSQTLSDLNTTIGNLATTMQSNFYIIQVLDGLVVSIFLFYFVIYLACRNVNLIYVQN